MTNVWFITGASRGLGLEIARAALRGGHRVVATARNPKSLAKDLAGFEDRLLALTLDVTDPDQAVAAVRDATGRFGRIDVLVNNAGYGQLGMFEDTSHELIAREFATNVFGAMHVTRAVLPVMRRQQSGRIFMISSISGMCADAGASIYNGSKFALEGWSEGLGLELAPFGIKVTIVEPGFFRTDFLDGSSVHFSDMRNEAYAEAWATKQEFLRNRNHNQAGDPARLGPALLRLASEAEPPVRFTAGTDALERLRTKIELLRKESEQWSQLSASTDGAFQTR